MAEFRTVETIFDFRALDDGDVLEGYLDGFYGAPEPGSDHSRSYWHGWRNGMIESDRAPPDFAYENLEHEFRQGCPARH